MVATRRALDENEDVNVVSARHRCMWRAVQVFIECSHYSAQELIDSKFVISWQFVAIKRPRR